jgi:hypothetical protein
VVVEVIDISNLPMALDWLAEVPDFYSDADLVEGAR